MEATEIIPVSGGMGQGRSAVIGEKCLHFWYILIYCLIGCGMWEKEESNTTPKVGAV